MRFHLRRAARGDARFLLELRNDALVREASFNSDEIPFEAHENWFAEKLADAKTMLCIAEAEGDKMAQVRFDVVSIHEAEVSIAVAKPYRGKGYGALILSRASRWFLKDHPSIMQIHAFIKPDNVLSIKSFQNAGYELKRQSVHKGQRCVEMVLGR